MVNDDRVINNGIGFTKTQISQEDFICKILETLNWGNINFEFTDVEIMLLQIDLMPMEHLFLF